MKSTTPELGQKPTLFRDRAGVFGQTLCSPFVTTKLATLAFLSLFAVAGCSPLKTTPPSRLPLSVAPSPMNKNRLLIALSESAHTDFGRVRFADQSKPQQVFSAVWALESQVNNGGFLKYFASSDFDTANFSPTALRAIGAEKCARISERALRALSSSPLPDSQQACGQLVASLSVDARKSFDALDSEFMAYPDNLTELLYAYVAAHPESFGPIPK